MVDVSAALETESANGKEPLVGAVGTEGVGSAQGVASLSASVGSLKDCFGS